MYKQITLSDWYNTPYTGGWCLKYVADAFGQPYSVTYPTAISAFHNAQRKHLERPPLGIEVPVFFYMREESAGHVAIQLTDGKVASSSEDGYHSHPYLHNSIDDLIAYYSSVYDIDYAGFTEDLQEKEIIRWEQEPTPPEPVIENIGGKMYITGSEELKKHFLVIVDTTGVIIKRFGSVKEYNDVVFGADLKDKWHSTNADLLSHLWAYNCIASIDKTQDVLLNKLNALSNGALLRYKW
jgi:hypothetical protein